MVRPGHGKVYLREPAVGQHPGSAVINPVNTFNRKANYIGAMGFGLVGTGIGIAAAGNPVGGFIVSSVGTMKVGVCVAIKRYIKREYPNRR